MSKALRFRSSLSGSRIDCEVLAPPELRKFVKNNKMFAIYDSNIDQNESIINIPVISTVLPLAWLTNTDIVVSEIDQNYKMSMDRVRDEFSKMYQTRFTTEIKADKLVENDIPINDSGSRYALLFSGGVDSTYSLLTNMELKPRMTMIYGLEGYPYPKNSEYWERVVSTYSEYANNNGLKFHIIKTNALDILYERRIEHKYHNTLMGGTLWGRIQHSLVLIPLLAPLSMSRFDTILFSATHPSTHDYEKEPYATQPIIDENIKWGNISVKHVGAIHRYEKIAGVIADYLKENNLTLRCCMNHKNAKTALNCGLCPHCFTVLPSLVLNEIDPNTCGFDLKNSTFQILKNRLEKIGFSEGGLDYIWGKIYENIPKETENDLYGSKEFFKWFKNVDLEGEIKKSNKNYLKVIRARKIYNNSPWYIAKILDEIYKKLGIEIHEHTPRDIYVKRAPTLTNSD